MSLRMRIYYNAVCGALGGLLAWAISGLLLGSTTTSFAALLAHDALLGAVAGICIGGALGAVDGFQARNWRQAGRGLFYGGALGLIGGLVGLVASEMIFSAAGGGLWPRTAGWAVFGGLVGASEGIATRSADKRTYGALGGVLGGIVGGSTYERISDLLRVLTHNRDLSLTIGGAVGLVLLGACLGAMIALTVVLLRAAWVRMLGGRLEGREVLVGKARMTIGASDGCDVYLPGDSAIASQHAVLQRAPRGYTLTVTPGATPVAVDHQPLAAGASIALRGGEHLRFGSTPVLFRLEGDEEADL